jgi:ribosomal protein L40E
MKVFIWISVLFCGGLINIGISSIMSKLMEFYSYEVWSPYFFALLSGAIAIGLFVIEIKVARVLCKKWEDHKTNVTVEKNEISQPTFWSDELKRKEAKKSEETIEVIPDTGHSEEDNNSQSKKKALFCRKCGAKRPDIGKFCNKCGTEFIE